MMTNSKLLRSTLLVFLGTFLYALTIKLFLEPSGLVTGGTTGIGLALQRTLGISLSVSVLVMDSLLLAWAYFDLGKSFVVQTIFSTLAYPFCLELCEILLQGRILTQDILLCTIFAGLGIGASLGIVIHSGASTGGIDIPPLSLQKHFGINLALSMNVLDFIIIVGQVFFTSINSVLYGIVLVIIYTMVMDHFLVLGQRQMQVTIISKKAEEIRQHILEHVDRGVTIFYGEGGYLRERQDILVTIARSRDIPKLQRIIEDVDPISFMTISHVNTVRGRGFSLSKKYR